MSILKYGCIYLRFINLPNSVKIYKIGVQQCKKYVYTKLSISPIL